MVIKIRFIISIMIMKMNILFAVGTIVINSVLSYDTLSLVDRVPGIEGVAADEMVLVNLISQAMQLLISVSASNR